MGSLKPETPRPLERAPKTILIEPIEAKSERDGAKVFLLGQVQQNRLVIRHAKGKDGGICYEPKNQEWLMNQKPIQSSHHIPWVDSSIGLGE